MSFYIDVKLHSRHAAVEHDVTLHRDMVTREDWALAMGKRVCEAREAMGLGVNELDRRIGQTSGYTSPLEKGQKTRPAIDVLIRIAEELGVRPAWLIFGEGQRRADTFPPEKSDPPFGTFMLKIAKLPKLGEWLEDHPGEFTVSQIARAIALYEDSPPKSREDGVPLKGWKATISDLLRAGWRPQRILGHQAAAEELEREQAPHVRHARKNRRRHGDVRRTPSGG